MSKATEIPKTDYLWRYMDVDKYISTLAFKDMYFPSTSNYEDSFENYCDIVESVCLGKNIDSLYTYYRKKESEEIKRTVGKEEKKKWLASLFCRIQDATVVSCWHHNNNQSDAMWKLYTTNDRCGVAIRTTVGKLQEQYPENKGFKIGKVQYIDYSDFVPDAYEAKWYKRKNFMHESEVRIARVEDNYGKRKYNDDGSVARTAGIAHFHYVNFNELIDKVYISPYASLSFANTIASINKKYDIECPLIFQDRIWPAGEHWIKPRKLMETYL